MCHSRMVSEVGLREMRQHASDLLRRAEAGERVTITVAGRPAAVLGPVAPHAWRGWAEVADAFARAADPEWAEDRDLIEDVLVAKSPQARASRLARLSAIQRRFEPLPVDEAVADSYGVLAAAVVQAGRKPRARSMDLLIAATAHAHGAAVYTRNADDLAGLEDLIEIVTL